MEPAMPDVTVAVKVTAWFTDDGVGDATTAVDVEVEVTACNVVPELVTKFASPLYTALTV
jgi:hypothetical protein